MSWGAADFTGGLKSRTVPIALVLLLIQGTGVTLVAAWVLASGAPFAGAEHAVVSLLAGVAGLTGLALFYRALAIGTMSIVAPVSACGVIIPVMVGLASGEALSLVTGAGMVAAFVGVVLASREGPADTDRDRRGSRLSILLALVSAVGFGTFFTLSDIAAETSVSWLLLLSRIITVVPLAALVLATRPGLPPGGDRWVLVGAGVLDASATALYSIALREGDLSVVSVVGSLYPVATVLLARAVLHERVRRAQAAGVGLAFCGVLLIVAGG